MAVTAALALTLIILLIFGCVALVRNIFFREEMGTWKEAGDVEIQTSFLTPSEYSRPQKELKEVKAVVIHNVGSAGVTAVGSRNHFEQMRVLKTNAASVHFIVGLEGEIIQCIPVNEIAYATAERNADTIAIEYCHNDDIGTPEDETYSSLVKLTARVCEEYKLSADDILRHYDATEVNCPYYFVENEAAWTKFKEDVMKLLK